VNILIWAPLSSSPSFVETDLVRRFRNIENARVLVDPGGVEAKRFGAMTSGQAALYAPDGSLAFQGGLTAARGRSGPSRGMANVVSAVRSGSGVANTDVFGCGLGGPVRASSGNRS
jgi:hypothetical protein